MQVSFEQTSSFLLDLVSRFLNKILEKDTNNSYYLQEWNSFRQLICEKSLDIPKVLIFISQLSSPNAQIPQKDDILKLLDHNIMKARSRDVTPVVSPDIPPSTLPPENRASVSKSNRNLFIRNRSLTHVTSKYALPSSPSSEIKKVQVNKTPRSRLLNINTPRKIYDGVENTERIMISHEKGYPPIKGFSSRTYRALEPHQGEIIKTEFLKPKETGKKHDLSFLAKRANKLTELMVEHNEKLEMVLTSPSPAKEMKGDDLTHRSNRSIIKLIKVSDGIEKGF